MSSLSSGTKSGSELRAWQSLRYNSIRNGDAIKYFGHVIFLMPGGGCTHRHQTASFPPNEAKQHTPQEDRNMHACAGPIVLTRTRKRQSLRFSRREDFRARSFYASIVGCWFVGLSATGALAKLAPTRRPLLPYGRSPPMPSLRL